MSKLKPPVDPGDHHKGKIDGSVTLVEFGDYECPHCGRAHPLIKKLLNEINDLHFVFRNFPLQEIHPNARIAALAAEAAANQDRYWEMHDLIFEHQKMLTSNYLMVLAKKIGLNLQQFEEDMKSENVENKVEFDFESGVRSGVNGTPSFFVNGMPVLTYDETYESLVEAVEMR
ncbi:MAG: thioredoxin domain-containing protein [Ginsengibacter sp.]